MSIDVTVLRVFTDSLGRFGNPLGVVDSSAVPPGERQRIAAELGYSETVFVENPASGSCTAHAHIFTPEIELPFAGHPAVGVAWWLRNLGTPVHTLQLPAGIAQIRYPDLETAAVVARSEWAPEFAIHDLGSAFEVESASPADYPDDIAHYLWAWVDAENGRLRSRMFAANLGVAEDEATGSAAVRMTDYLNRDLTIIQGRGSRIDTTWNPEGWVTVTGRVVFDQARQLN